MKVPIHISEMPKFHFGGKIVCLDGESGHLVHVVFDVATRRMTSLGVRYGHLPGNVTDLPYDAVSQATGESIQLYLARAELAAAHQADVQGAVLDRKSLIARDDGSGQGTLRQIAVRPANATLAYVVAHHLRPGQDTLLQEEYITLIASHHLTITIAERELRALPPYRPDDELQREVEHILFELTPLHLDLRRITPRVLDSVLYLEGNVSNQLRADIVEDQVQGVSGLLEVKNGLVGDDQLAADLALLLGHDPSLEGLLIGVYPLLGTVRLSGSVRTNKQRMIAENDVQGFPGVRSVINHLTINPNVDMLPVLSPTGIEAEDQVPGKYIRHTR
jgi:osmotically-inducible protein OsmY